MALAGRGSLIVTNAPGTGTLDIRRGTLIFNGGNIVVDQLLLTNGGSGVITFNSGTLISRGTAVSNFKNFVIGDTGSGGATFVANGGSHGFGNELAVGNTSVGNALVISNGAVLVNSSSYVGRMASSSSNSVLVSGADSQWRNQGLLTIGRGGDGNALTI